MIGKSKKTVREPRTFVFRVEKRAFDLDKAFLVNEAGLCSISLQKKIYSHLAKIKRPRSGDTIRLECNGEFIEGWLPAKPPDCVVVERFEFRSNGTDGSI